MRYRFVEPGPSLKQTLCSLNGIEAGDLDVSGFVCDYGLEALSRMREKIFAYRDKRFFIVGDYDCDGICATLIMKKLLDDLGIANNYYIPSRCKEGYGLNEKILETVMMHGFDVLLCVDNGVRCQELFEKAMQKGIACLVIDHHEYDELPAIDAVLHPDLLPAGYADMCAAGLCDLLSQSVREDEQSMVYGGLATVADMVKVLGYNRFAIMRMMKILENRPPRPISSLLGRNDCTLANISYQVIPKINAVSRLEEQMNVNYVVRFLLDQDGHHEQYLKKIEEINDRRKFLTKQMYSTCKRLIDPHWKVLIVSSDEFYEGICGLTANRLMYEFEKPVLVLSRQGDELKGSGRSPQGIDLYGLLKEHERLFDTFGGHANAVGLSLKASNLQELEKALEESAFDQVPTEKSVILLGQELFNDELMNQLEELQPFGTGFPEPLFAIRKPSIRKKTIVSSTYPKYTLSGVLDAISFNSSDLDRRFTSMVGKLSRDSYHRGQLSFVIEDLLDF